jgi:hypothetical protein
MGVDIRGAGGAELASSYSHWARVLRLAHAFGWKPAGTVLYDWVNDAPETPVPGWSGSYLTSDYATVTAEDARALAAALRRALWPENADRWGAEAPDRALVAEICEMAERGSMVLG